MEKGTPDKNLRKFIPRSSRQFFGKENFKESFLYQTGVADSEKRTPDAKFRPFSSFLKSVPEIRKRSNWGQIPSKSDVKTTKTASKSNETEDSIMKRTRRSPGAGPRPDQRQSSREEAATRPHEEPMSRPPGPFVESSRILPSP